MWLCYGSQDGCWWLDPENNVTVIIRPGPTLSQLLCGEDDVSGPAVTCCPVSVPSVWRLFRRQRLSP